MKDVVEKLRTKGCTIAAMESCTGGAVASAITDIEGSSEVLKFSAVTYSNEYKIKMGVDKEIIDKYTVYSKETAVSMAKSISSFALSDYGIGITGKLNRIDKNNLYGADNQVFVCIYDKNEDKNYNLEILVDKNSRVENKEFIIQKIINKLIDII